MTHVRVHALAALVCLAGTEPICVQAAELQVVGAVGAANADPSGKAPGKAARVLRPGNDIFFHDRISTKRGGSAQLAFLDRSTLSIGENSDVTIDEFVYRPGGKAAMTASLAKGVLRYVGGEISHGGGTTIKTPTVTIGIRGGIGMIGTVTDASDLKAIPGLPSTFQGGTFVVNGYGTITLSNDSGQTILSRPGFASFVDARTGSMSAPVRINSTTAQAIMQTLTSRQGQSGGALAQGSGVRVATAQNAIRPTLASVDVAGTAQLSELSHTLDRTTTAPVAPGINALQFTNTFAGGSGLTRTRSQARQSVQLVQTLATMPQAVVGTSGGRIVVNGGPIQNSPGFAIPAPPPGPAPLPNSPVKLPLGLALPGGPSQPNVVAPASVAASANLSNTAYVIEIILGNTVYRAIYGGNGNSQGDGNGQGQDGNAQ